MANTIRLKPKPFEKVRAAMQLKGYTNYDLMAKSIGLSYSGFERKINGKTEFTLNECKLIAKKLDSTLDALFSDGNSPNGDIKFQN